MLPRFSTASLVVCFSIALFACGGGTETRDAESTDVSVDAIVANDAAADARDAMDAADVTAPVDAQTDGNAACPCFLGDGPYCGARARALATAQGCTLGVSAGANDLLACEDGAWRVADACTGSCAYDEASTELNDACVLPVCPCFVQSAYCGSGAADVAATMHCRIPLLPEHENDILYCPGGVWTVREMCPHACHEAPAGTPDYCETASNYRLPLDCGYSARCSNGNHTSNHDGNDEYAYDFAVPIGTRVRAIRGGTVLRVRFVSPPGSSCANGGGSSCANFANTVEVRHDDGTVGLYMHLSRPMATVGARVAQGDVLGLSGNSGYSTGPHVHVQVQANCGIWWCQSRPFNFVEGAITTGTTRTSTNACP